SLLAFLAYFAAEFSTDENKEKSWRKIARSAFFAHGFSVIGIFVLLFVMILNHWFEYHYAWRHSSTELPMKYIISSFWEGQEGSFLLWQFWLVILGFVGIKTMKGYENPVMGIVALVQFFLGSMVLGIYIFGFKFGSSPFVLLRNEMANAPIFQKPDYLSFIKDGNGLNPLLQNYWMTIPPPVLFCGFASVTIPFAYAVASLLRRDWDGWVKPVLPWVLFSTAVLGTGILMGGAWAYESLSFGGFWAWDPVENMSFVPWIMIVAGLHMVLVYRYTKHSLISAYVFFLLGFITVLYSTYLTRSGRLGDTSVHSFTDDGLEPQLLTYFAFFIVSGFTLLFIRIFKKQIPSQQKEEEIGSREFWMFIGTLVLLLSAVQMTFTTSIPVWNLLFHDRWKLIENKIAPPENVIAHYNAIQIWLGILVGMLTGLVQFFSYKLGKFPATVKWGMYSFAAAVLAAIAISLAMHINFTQQHVIDLTSLSDSLFLKFPFVSTYFLFLVASLFAVFGNLAYLVIVQKGNWRLLGGSVTHFGFGVFLVGVLLSQGEKEVISLNKSGVNFGKDFKDSEKMENILLLKDSTLVMHDYEVTYVGTLEEKPNNFYKVKYLRKDSASGKVIEEFTLMPNAQLNPKMGLVANPDTKHYLTRDVFTHVSSVPDNTNLKDTTITVEAAVGDSFFTRTALIKVEALNPKPTLPADFDPTGKLVVGVNLSAKDENSKTYTTQPVFIIDMSNGNAISSLAGEVKELGMEVEVYKIDPQTKKLTLSIHETEKPLDFIIMKAIVFPYINLVWLGGILTFLGALLSMWRRATDNNRQ
ncbi:MAG TPA: cytochrome c biogenesis protein CcsA, partial [Chitinophagales bacterium]|nr:cytochrome c biogenesis protein CcsA [Chitinophagales bacterium]